MGAYLRPSWSGVRIAGPSYDGSGGTNTVGWNVGGGTPGGAGGSCRGGKRRSKISAMYLPRIRNADLGGRAQLRKDRAARRCGGIESDAAIVCARWPVRPQRDARAHMTRLPCAFSVDADGTGRRHALSHLLQRLRAGDDDAHPLGPVVLGVEGAQRAAHRGRRPEVERARRADGELVERVLRSGPTPPRLTGGVARAATARGDDARRRRHAATALAA